MVVRVLYISNFNDRRFSQLFMKKFILKIILFSIVVVIACVTVDLVFFNKFDTAPSAGNTLLREKYDFFLKGQYNTVAIGSSKIFRHFNANQFDTLCSAEGIKSFNLGVEGTFPPETYYFLEQLLRENTQLKNILLEVRAIDAEEYANWHTIRSYYWLDLKKYRDYLSIINQQRAPTSRKVFAYLSGSVATFDRYLSIGKGEYILNRYRIGYPQEEDFTANKGFEPFKQGSYTIPKDTSEFVRMTEASKQAFEKIQPNKYSKTHLEFLSKLSEMARQKGINLYFIMGESQKEFMYNDLLPLFIHIDSLSSLTISNANVYPDLYYVKNKANVTHLNEAGSRLFTKYLAEQFVDKLKKREK